MTLKRNKALLLCLFGLSLWSSSAQADENCSWLSWTPDMQNINRTLLNQFSGFLAYPMLCNEYFHWYNYNSEGFARDCLLNESKRKAVVQQFFAQKSFVLEQTNLSALNTADFVTLFAANILKNRPEIKDVSLEQAQAIFEENVYSNFNARTLTYRMFLVNELCRKSYAKNIESCSMCQELTARHITLQAEKVASKKIKAQASPQLQLCRKHKKQTKVGLGVFTVTNFDGSQEVPEYFKKHTDKPDLKNNPSLAVWRPAENERSMAIVAPDFYKDLRTFVGDEGEEHENLLLRINRTQTHYGYAFFDYLFATPSKILETLVHRQAFVKELVDNDQLYSRLRAVLDRVEECQNDVNFFIFEQPRALTDKSLYLYADGAPPMQALEIQANLPFGLSRGKGLVNRINKNKLVLTIMPVFKVLVALFGVAGACMFLKGLYDAASDKSEEKSGLKALANLGLNIPNSVKSFGSGVADIFDNSLTNNSLTQFIGRNALAGARKFDNFCTGHAATQEKESLPIKIFDYIKVTHKDAPIIKISEFLILILLECPASALARVSGLRSLAGLGVVLFGALKALESGVGIFATLKKSKAALAESKKSMLALKKLFVAMQDLNKILAECEVAGSALTLAGDLTEFVLNPNDLTQKIKGIDKDSSKETILSVLRDVYPLRWNLSRPLEAVGQIDAFVSAATLLREHKNKPNGFCFAEFDQSGQPGLELDGFWFPYINATEALPNSFGLGFNKTARHMLLSGLNGGGKSTVFRAVSFAILSGQVFGLSAAQQSKFSLYDFFISNMTSKDNPAEKKSLFMVQAESVINNMRKSIDLFDKQGLRSFAVIDEICGGTGELSGAPLGLTLAEDIAKTKHHTMLLSSHFYGMGEAEVLTGGLFKNFKIIKETDVAGHLKMTYKLAPGRPNKFSDAVGIEVARDRCNVDKDFIRRAEELKLKYYGRA